MSIWPHNNAQAPEPLPDPERARARESEDSLLASVLKQSRQPRTNATPSDTIEMPRAAITWTMPGFDRRCRVSTNFGDLPIEALRRHDKVKTLSGAYRDVERIDEIRLDADFLSRHSEAHPVQIRMRSFAVGQPVRNTLVSPAQAVCTLAHVGNPAAKLALNLVGLPGICRMPQAEMSYFRFHCGAPETVCIDGAWFQVAPWT